jgi:teichuronic acid biosynthesis glycosyltransferase TuaG
MEDKVSVIIPTYNRYELLCNSIRSVLNQSYTNYEIIVVNDCSTDERYYQEHLEQFPNTRFIHLEVNQKIKYNCSAAQGMVRQVGLEHATGEWIAFLDDDDFFHPDKLKLQLDYMKRTSSKFCSSNMMKIQHTKLDDKQLHATNLGYYFKSQTIPGVLTLQIIQQTNFICNSTVILHKSLLDKVGSFYPIRFEDWNYWLRVLEYVPCHYIDQPLVYYTVQIAGTSNPKYYVY